MVVIAQFLLLWAGVSLPLSLVTSNSMEPTLVEGDIVAWMPTSMEDVEIGDVVVFESYIKWPCEKLMIHRVTDIKRDDSTGSLMLETKGDANEWKDQNRPSLQSPYIYENHLLGKAICIGQQPLKIPLIGHIGIWINEGFDMLVP